jgi:hypothetical protein
MAVSLASISEHQRSGFLAFGKLLECVKKLEKTALAIRH